MKKIELMVDFILGRIIYKDVSKYTISSFHMRLIAICLLLCICMSLCSADSSSSTDREKLQYINAVLAVKKAVLNDQINQGRVNLDALKHGSPELRPAPPIGTSLKDYDPTQPVEYQATILGMIQENQQESLISFEERKIALLEKQKNSITPITDYSAYVQKKQKIQTNLEYYNQKLIPYAENEVQRLEREAASAFLKAFEYGTGVEGRGENLQYQTLSQKYKNNDYVYEKQSSSPTFQVSPLVEADRAGRIRTEAVKGLNQFRGEKIQMEQDLSTISQDEHLAENIFTLVHLFGGSMDPQPQLTIIESVPDKTETSGEGISVEVTEISTIAPTPTQTPLSTCPDGSQIENGACHRPQEDCSKYFNHHWEGGYFYEGAYGVCMCDGRVTNCE